MGHSGSSFLCVLVHVDRTVSDATASVFLLEEVKALPDVATECWSLQKLVLLSMILLDAVFFSVVSPTPRGPTR